jgi:hypothetical protein
MTTLKDRLSATDQQLKELKDSRKAADKVRRQVYKQSKADRDPKVIHVGEAVLHRVERGEVEFRQMMDKALSRPSDRSLFDLE